MRGRYRVYLYTPGSTHTYPLVINITHQNGTFFTKDEPMLTHHSQHKSIIYLRVYSLCCAFYGFGQMSDGTYPSTQRIFTALKIFCDPPVHLSHCPPSPRQPLMFFIVSIVLPFLKWHVVGLLQCVAFSDMFLSLNNMHLGFLHVFS